MIRIKELTLRQKLYNALRNFTLKHFLAIPTVRLLGQLELEDMDKIKLEDIPFEYEETREYLARLGLNSLSDVALHFPLCYDLLDHTKILVDILDTLKREYNEEPFQHIVGLNEYNYKGMDYYTGMLEIIQETIERYRNSGVEGCVMPWERFKVYTKMWDAEFHLDYMYLLRDNKDGQKRLEDAARKWEEAVEEVRKWDKEHGYGSKMYV
jgi:hypothetical protein